VENTRGYKVKSRVEDKYEKIVKLAKRRGFFWNSYEIYGGLGGFITLGPLGVLLRNNIIEKWRRVFIHPHQEFIVEIDSPIISPEKVFVASGHVDHFTDYVVECKRCGRNYRADHLIEEATSLTGLEKLTPNDLTKIIIENNVTCPECGGPLSEVKTFNLLFKTTIGPYSGNIGYARPETAQGMFVNFNRIYQIMRRKLPLGIAQIGRVLRNEISPRQGPIRLREFTIMEIELFYDPKNPSCKYIDKVLEEKLRLITGENVVKGDKTPIEVTVRQAVENKMILNEWNAYFMALSKKFLEELGVPAEKQVFIEKLPEERAHYAAQTYDQLVYVERWGWIEVSGHAYRTDYDLKQHTEYSGKDLRAQRRLEIPKVVKTVEVKPLLGRIVKDFGKSVVSPLLDYLNTADKEKIVEVLRKSGELKVAVNDKRISIPASYFQLNEKMERIEYEKFFPHVAEPSFGVERLFYITLEYSYTEKGNRIVLRIPRDLAPIKVGVLPIVEKKDLVEKATEIYNVLLSQGFEVIFDSEGSIGRRYARLDEIGVPFAITIDRDTLENNTITIRDRDTWQQVRVPVDKVSNILMKAFKEPGKSLFEIIRA